MCLINSGNLINLKETQKLRSGYSLPSGFTQAVFFRYRIDRQGRKTKHQEDHYVISPA